MQGNRYPSMKKTLLLLLLLPFCFAAAAEGAIDRAWVERNYRKTEYRIPMRDGRMFIGS